MYSVGSTETSFYFEEIVCPMVGYVYIFSIDSDFDKVMIISGY